MNLAWISLVALLVAITLSMLTQVNVGVVSGRSRCSCS